MKIKIYINITKLYFIVIIFNFNNFINEQNTLKEKNDKD